MDRRDFIKLAAAAPLLAQAAPEPADDDAQRASQAAAALQHQDAMHQHANLTGGSHLTIGMLVYPGMFLQDLVGPLAVFESLMHREIHLLWKNTDPPTQEQSPFSPLIPVTPTTSFHDCPAQLDVLFVPGGIHGTLALMEDTQVLQFLAHKGKTARYITSVCTGSLILGAAGLLDGYEATSHWLTLELLAELGAIPTKKRIVVDRNRVTGGGVTSGIDFGLKIVSLLRSDTYAQAVQLYLEYDPEPPFQAGSPEKAPPAVKRFLDEMFSGTRAAAMQAARRIRARNTQN